MGIFLFKKTNHELEKQAIFGELCDRYHGDALTTTREAWLSEIDIMQRVLMPWKETDARIVFEYDMLCKYIYLMFNVIKFINQWHPTFIIIPITCLYFIIHAFC